MMDQEDPEKRITDLERQVAAPRTAREARDYRKHAPEDRNHRLLEARKRVRDEAGVNAAHVGRTSLFVSRMLAVLGLLGIVVFIVGLALRHTTPWIWIGGLALFFGGFVPWIAADDLKVENVRWQGGTARKRVRDEAGVNPAQQGRTKLVVARTLAVLGLSGIAVFVAGLVLRHTTSWIWIGGLALFFGGFVPIFGWIAADHSKVEKVRWQEGTVTFRTVELGTLTEDGRDVNFEVELNPTGRITWVFTQLRQRYSRAEAYSGVEAMGMLKEKRLVVGATMRCLIDRIEDFAFRAFPYAKPDAPLPYGDELLFYEGKSPC